MLCGYHLFFWVYLNDLLFRGRVGQWMTEVLKLHEIHGYALSHIVRSQLLMAIPSRWVRVLRNTFRNESANLNLLSNTNGRALAMDDPQERERSFLTLCVQKVFAS